jgi:hypothetical protein
MAEQRVEELQLSNDCVFVAALQDVFEENSVLETLTSHSGCWLSR